MTETRVAKAQAAEAHERRAMRRSLRWVSRLLRLFALALIAVGGIGLVIGNPTDWWTGPSWFSLIVGLALFFASIVQRVRTARSRVAGLPPA